MLKSRILLLPIIMLFFLCGCVQTLFQSSVSRDKDNVSASTSASEYEESTEKINNKDKELTQVDPVVAENNMESSALDPSKNENIIPDNASLIKNIQPVLDEALDFCQVSQDFWQKGELENALEALDQAYSLILKIDTNDNPEIIQQKEDLRFMISKRILEIYASRNIVVNGNHNAIPMVMNKHIQAAIDQFTKYNEKDFFIESYKRSGKYRPLIVSDLKAAGLPVELSWIPLIESGFKVNAFSRARALGLWQFIPSTGYKFGLKRNKYIDERIDPVKSTKAAIEYLKELHKIFGDWTTSLAAYNCGEGRVLRVIRSQKINYLDNFWDLYERLPRETARYVPRFMATLHIVNNPEKYGLDSIIVDPPLEYEVITVSKQVHLNDVAKNIDVSSQLLKDLNPELRYKILPPDRYPLRIPPNSGDLLHAKLPEIPVKSPPQRAYVYHRVRFGETLSTIARRYRTSVRSIARANNIRRSDFIVAGKRLKIPLSGKYVASKKTTRKKKYRQASTHVVKSGDSLWIIANRYGTTTKRIQELNNLQSTDLHIGQVLKMSGGKKETPVINGSKIYQVKPGDSPYQIALLHSMSLERFLRINQLTPRSKIYPGQKMYVE